MKNTNCTDCGVRSDVAKMVGADIVNGKCAGCRGETVVNLAVVLKKRIADRLERANKPVTPVTYGRIWSMYPRRVGAVKAESKPVAAGHETVVFKRAEWTPEIAEAMRIPH